MTTSLQRKDHSRLGLNASTAYLEIALEGAVILCIGLFRELPDRQTRLTQRITLDGENASSYKGEVQRTFDLTLAPGMSRIAIAVDRA
jgi:hypothetical protein